MQQRRVGFHFGAEAPHGGEQFLDAFALIRGHEENLPPVPRGDGAEGIHFLGRAQVDLVDDLQLTAQTEILVEGVQLVVDEIEARPRVLLGVHIFDAEDVHEKTGPLHMLEETVPKALPFTGAFDEAGDVRHHHTLIGIVLVDHDAEVGRQRGEGIGRNLGPGRRNAGNEGGLARIGQSDDPRVRKDLEFEAQIALLAGFAGLRETGCAHGRGLEVLVALAAASAPDHQIFVARFRKVGQHMLAFGGLLEHERAHGQVEDQILALAPVALAAHATLPVLRLVVAHDAEVVQAQKARIGAQDDAAAVAAVAAVRPAAGYEFFTPERHAAVPALAGLDADYSFIHKTHMSILFLT